MSILTNFRGQRFESLDLSKLITLTTCNQEIIVLISAEYYAMLGDIEKYLLSKDLAKKKTNLYMLNKLNY